MVANVMVQAFKNADGITVSQPATEDEALSQLKDGKVQGVLVLPPDRQRSFAEAGATTRLAFHYDNSDLATAGQVVGLTQRVVESVGNGIAQVQPKLASDRWA
jgi:hypothetical protein